MQVLEAIFVFCCVWSLGACVIQRPGCEDRDRCLQVPLVLLLLYPMTTFLLILTSQPVCVVLLPALNLNQNNMHMLFALMEDLQAIILT